MYVGSEAHLTAPKVHLSIPSSYLAKLRGMAEAANLTPEDYILGVVLEHSRRDGVDVAAKRPVGRPLKVRPDDMPADVERSSAPSGFNGVVKVGRLWGAKGGRELIGTFSGPEVAAFARHYMLRGFRVGRGAAIGVNSKELAAALDYARKAGYDSTPLPTSPPLTAAELGQKDPQANPDEGSTKEPGEATADGGTAPTTLPETVAQLNVFSQVTAAFVGSKPGCSICGDVLTTEPVLCTACIAAFEVWNALPAGGEPAAPGSDPQLSGSSTSESFVDYVRRTRGLP